MLKRKRCVKKKSIFAAMIVLKVNPSCNQQCHKPRKCKIRKKCCKKRLRRKRCFPIFPCPPKRCHRKRPRPCPIPIPVPCCIDPIDPVKPNIPVEKECCGNLLIQGGQPAFQIWENDVDSKISVVQITIYSFSSSTESIEVEIDGDEIKHMTVPPGNTTNFIGHGIKTVKVSAKGNEHAYVEGKYVISITLHLPDPPASAIKQ